MSTRKSLSLRCSCGFRTSAPSKFPPKHGGLATAPAPSTAKIPLDTFTVYARTCVREPHTHGAHTMPIRIKPALHPAEIHQQHRQRRPELTRTGSTIPARLDGRDDAAEGTWRVPCKQPHLRPSARASTRIRQRNRTEAIVLGVPRYPTGTRTPLRIGQNSPQPVLDAMASVPTCTRPEDEPTEFREAARLRRAAASAKKNK